MLDDPLFWIVFFYGQLCFWCGWWLRGIHRKSR